MKINYRLIKRESMTSQIREIRSEEAFKKTLESSKKPTDYEYLIVDTGKTIESYMDKVINYINE